MAIRKDANTLSSVERRELVDAILELKQVGIYDQFVQRHANANMTAIHRCPAFLPWHRRFIWDFERELQRVSGNPDLGLPYWNWPEGGSNASLWDDDLLGGNGHSVTQVVSSGPFREGQWTIINASGQNAGSLTRAFAREPWAQSLPTQAEIDQVLSITPYDAAPWNTGATRGFRNQLEGFLGPNLHNRGHGWVGGSMLPMTSPNDPVFFMHHCMVDKLWHDWQALFPTQGYLPVRRGAFGQNINDPMDSTPSTPIQSRPADVLQSHLLEISYDDEIRGPSPLVPPFPELIIDDAAVNGQIATSGEVDQYQFDVTAFNTFIIETSGPSDTLISLSGPSDITTQIATDDDSGEQFNSRIEQSLPTGRYFVSAQLFNPDSTGTYKISVRLSADNTAIPQIQVNGPALSATIANPKEIDLFRFTIPTSGRYIIQTSGSTDTYINLFGPDSQDIAIAEDDDSGTSRNSRLRLQLAQGEYFVSVRHFSPLTTGAYQIQVTE
ncbi:MAG: tyrosinase family protein [Methylococcales bacterium]|nr:tyrosinase family protein [Methylococcales bacterium]